ncbi:hypothetical protein PR001_g12427 [Phytophthora rubi]|uniref:Uncharacterized protein n=1 Tax=Phytophthora rubi TaxID=129364 RepID=A0A6A3M1F3_9STRA|nr:hypothetical protein PR001_g12427 [Phytophthora rubi]
MLNSCDKASIVLRSLMNSRTVNKCQIFKRPLVVDFINVRKVIKTCKKNHNFCIDERFKDKDAASGMHAVSMEPKSSYQTTENTDEGDILRSDVQGRILREAIVNHIQNFNLRRPRSRITRAEPSGEYWPRRM